MTVVGLSPASPTMVPPPASAGIVPPLDVLAMVPPPPVLAIGVALLLEVAVGEVPEPVHPVAWFGAIVGRVDRSWNRPMAVGTAAAAGLPLAAAGTVGAVVATAAVVPWLGAVVAGVVLFVTVSLRSLLSVAREVIAATDADLPAARHRLPALVGRDPESLSAPQIRSAVVESLAENLADGLVAPLAAFVLGVAVGGSVSPTAGLAIASALAVWVKAVNTMDSMLGYRSKPVGWASARLDDAAMWLPARLTAIVLALAAGSPGAIGETRAWLDSVPSPNSGWPMGTIAAVLDVRLEKPGVYVLNPDASLPTVAEANAGVRYVAVAGLASYLLGGGLAWL